MTDPAAANTATRGAGFVEVVGAHEIARRLDRLSELLEADRGELDANEREHRELVDRHNLRCDEYERLARKLAALNGGGE